MTLLHTFTKDAVTRRLPRALGEILTWEQINGGEAGSVPAGIAAYNSTLTAPTDKPHTGLRSIKAVSTTAGGAGQAYGFTLSPTLVAGRRYRMGGWMYSLQTRSARWYSSGFSPTHGPYVVLPANMWVWYEMEFLNSPFVAPAIYPRIENNNGESHAIGDTVYFDDLTLYDSTESPMLVGDYEDTLEVGGYVSATCRIPEAERAAASTLYVAGATWEVRDDVSNDIIFKGEINDVQENPDGVVVVSAKGWGKQADRAFDRLLFQTRDTSPWQPSDQDPYNYTNQLKSDGLNGDAFTVVSGNATNLAGNGKRLDSVGTVLKHNLTGLTAGEAYEVRFEGFVDGTGSQRQKIKCTIYNETDNNIVTRGDRKINHTGNDDLMALAFKPVAGKTYSARIEWADPYSGWSSGASYKVGDHVNEASIGYTCTQQHTSDAAKKPDTGGDWASYWERFRPVLRKVRYARTPNFNSEKIVADIDGRRLKWRAKRGRFFGGESTSLVYWAPGINLTRIAFDIHRNHGSDDYTLDLLGATGPSGTLTQLDTWGMKAGDSKQITKTIATGYDLLMLRLHRKEAADQKHARAFRLTLENVRINSIAVGDAYTVEDAVKELGTRLGCSNAEVSTTTQNVLPFDVDSGTYGDALDEACLVADWHWGIYANVGGTRVMRAGPWGSAFSKTWRLTQVEAPVELVPLERFNRIAIRYRYTSGVTQMVKVTASPNPFPSLWNEYALDLDEPVPPLDITQAFGQTVINYLSLLRFGGSASFTLVEDDAAPGTPVSAQKVKPGDVLKLSNYGNLALRVKSVKHSETGIVQAVFADGHPMLEKILAQRRRLIALGRSNAAATLGPLDPAAPAVPENVALGFALREVRGDRAEYDVVVDWDAVTFDEDGDGTAVRRYIAQIRAVDKTTGVPIIRSGKELILRQVVSERSDTDPSNDPDTPTRANFRHIEKPKDWSWQARVKAEDLLGTPGDWSAWTGYYNPVTVAGAGTTAAADPSNVVMDIDQHVFTLRFDPPLDVEDSELINRDVSHFQAQVFDHTPTGGDGFSTCWQDGRSRRIKDEKFTSPHRVWRVSKPGTQNFYTRVRAVDKLGNKRSWVLVGPNNRIDPPAPSSAPSIVFTDDDEADSRINARVEWTYAGAHADDDLHGFEVQLQTKATNTGWSSTTGYGATRQRRRAVVNYNDTADDVHSALFTGIKAGVYCTARYRPFDKKGNKGAWSAWS